MTLLLKPADMKTNGFLNANVDDEYTIPSIEEAQDVFLREILGDALLQKLETLVESGDVSGIYGILLDEYIKYYLKYKTLSILCMNVNFKIRNMGVVSQYGNEAGTTNLEETKYIQNYNSEKADFYANRITKFLILNKKQIPEYKYCCKQVTNPDENHPACTIFLG